MSLRILKYFYIYRPYHSEFLLNESKVTTLSKVTESSKKNKDKRVTKSDWGKREKYTSTEDKNTKEILSTNVSSWHILFLPFILLCIFLSVFSLIALPRLHFGIIFSYFS